MNWHSIYPVALVVATILGLGGIAQYPCCAEEPIVVVPHPEAGKYSLKHDPDRPFIAAYGGIGLRKMTNGRWTGYGEISKYDVDQLVRRCQENGIRRIHPPMVEALYPDGSNAIDLTHTTEILRYFFEAAHDHDIEVFADLPVFAYFEAADKDFASKHPDMHTRSDSGEQDPHMLSAAHSEVRRYKRTMLMNYVRDFPVDGLQLDFIRYPYYSMDLREGFGRHGYDAPTLARFRKEHALAEDYMPAKDDLRWVQCKAENVSQFIRELRADLDASGITLPIGVYNSGTYGLADSLRTVHQDWRAWEKEGLVDEHHPMILMAGGMTTLTRAMQTLLKVKNEHSRVFGPIFLAEGFDPDKNDVPTPELVRDAARRLIKAGCDGLWFCRLAEIEQYNLWPVVNEISQWSLEEIRSESFDPYSENLLINPDFSSGLTGWHISQPEYKQNDQANPHSTGNGLVFSLRETSPQSLSQTVRFRSSPQYAVDSLQFRYSFSVPDNAQFVNDILFEGHLHYANGEEEDVTHAIKTKTGTTKGKIDLKARTNFAELFLEKFELKLTIPPGVSSLTVNELYLQRDPLLWAHSKEDHVTTKK